LFKCVPIPQSDHLTCHPYLKNKYARLDVSVLVDVQNVLKL
jgi:hypothetical protein